jgi:EAL domain-containing protein (putative c-di-GMP-specific phosphodiesterase class I)
VSRLTERDGGPELARAVVMLGSTLGLETVAEGIENEDQVSTLLDLGCVAGQGFLFGRSSTLDLVTETPFMVRRAMLRAGRSTQVDLTATGRFRVEDLLPRSASG